MPLRRSLTKSKLLIIFIVIAVATFFVVRSALAVSKVWSGGGTDGTCGGSAGDGNKWSCAANWTPSGAPASGDNVTFDGTSTKNATIDASFQGTITNLNINSGYAGTITAARSFTVTNTFTQAAGAFSGGAQTLAFFNLTISAGTFTSTSATLGIGGNLSISGTTTFNANGGTVSLNGPSNNSQTVSCTASTTFSSFNINRSSASSGYTVQINSPCNIPLGNNPNVVLAASPNSGYLYVNGTLSGTGTLTIAGTSSTAYMTLNTGSSLSGFSGLVVPNNYGITSAITSNFASFSPFTFNGGTITVSGGAFTMPSSGNFTIGGLAVSAGSFTSTSGILSVLYDFSISGTGSFVHNNGTVTLANAGSSGQNVSCNASTSFNNFNISRTAASSGYYVQINSTCNIPLGNNPTVVLAASPNSGYLYVYGTLSGTGTFTIAGTSSTASMNFYSGSSLSGFSGLVVPNNYGITSAITSNFASFSPFTFSGGNITVSGGAFTMPSSGNFTIGGLAVSAGSFTSTSGTLSLLYDFSISSTGSFVPNNGTVTLANAGSSGQNVSCNASTSFNNFNISRTAASSGYYVQINSPCSLPLGNNPTVVLAASPNTGYLYLYGTLSGTGTLTISGTSSTASMNLYSGSSLSGFSGLVVPTNYGITSATTANFASYSPFTYSGGSISVSGGAFTMPSSGNFSISSLTASNSASFTSTSGTLNIAGDFNFGGTSTFNANDGNIVLTGTNNQNISCTSNVTFNTFAINRASAGSTYYVQINSPCNLPLGANPNIVLGPATYAESFYINGATLSGTGTLTIAGTNNTYTFTLTSGSVLNGFTGLVMPNNMNLATANTANFSSFSPFTFNGGSITISGGALTMPSSGNFSISSLTASSSASFTSTSGTINIAGDFNFSGTSSFNANGGNIVLTGTNNQNISCTSNVTFNTFAINRASAGSTYYVQINSPCNLPLGANPNIVLGPATYTESFYINGATLSGSGTLTIAGTNNTYTFTLTSGSVLNGFTGLVMPNNMNLATANTANFSSYSPFTFSGGSITVSGGTFTMPSSGNFSISSLTASSSASFTSTSGTINIAGDFNFSGTSTFNANGGNVVLTGTNNQNISCTSNVTFNTFAINRASAGSTYQVLVNSPCNIPLGANPNLVLGPNGYAENFYINGATLTGSGTLTIAGTTNTYTFTLTSGSVLNGFTGLVMPNNMNLTTANTANFSSYSPFTFNGGSISVSAGSIAFPPNASFNVGNLTISGGSFTASSGTMSVSGNLSITGSPTFNANGGTINLTGSTTSMDCNNVSFNRITINKSNGHLTVNSTCNLPLGNNPTVVMGTGNNLYVNGTLSGTGTFASTSTSSWLVLNTGGSLSGFSGLNGASLQVAGATANFTSYNPFSLTGEIYVNAGTLSLPTISGGISITNFTLQGTSTFNSSAGVMNVSGAFAHTAGTFNANNGTIVFNGNNQTISGVATTFYNFTKILPTAAAYTLTFPYGVTETITNALVLNGYNTSNRLYLRSSSNGTQWKIDPQGSRNILYLDVKDGNNQNAAAVQMAGSGSVDSTNNTNFNFSNVAPNSPANLGPSTSVTGGAVPSSQPSFTFTTSDPNQLDTVKYEIQISSVSNFSSQVIDYTSALLTQGNLSFTVGQAAGGGTYTTGNGGQYLSTGSYYWRVKDTDNNTLSSGFATANSGSVAFVVDSSVPVATLLGPTNYVNSSTTSNTQPTLTFTITAGASDTVQYQIQISTSSNFSSNQIDYTSVLGSQGAQSFSVGQDAGSGSYTTGNSSQTLSTGSYYWRVRGTNGGGQTGAYVTANSGSVAFVEALTSDAPTGLTGTPGNHQVALSWTAPGDTGGSSITDYQVEFELSSGGSWAVFADGVSATTSATVTGLTNGSSYDFRVEAINAIGTSSPSSPFTTTPYTVPDAPSIGTATPGNAQASVTFSANGNGGSAITSYTVTSAPGLKTGSGSSSPITVSGLTNGTSYTFTVTATNAAGTSSPSSASGSVTPFTTPNAPSGLSTTPGHYQMGLNWNAPSGNGSAITDYLVEYKLSTDGSYTVFDDGVSTSTSATITSLTAGTTYNFKVAAINAAGTGSLSSAATATTLTVPGTPTGLSATPSNTQMGLSWNAPSNGGTAITDYIIEYKLTTSGSWGTFDDGTSGTASATVTGLTNGTSYDFRVTAVNVIGSGNTSNLITSTPRTVPDAPTIGFAVGGDSQASVSFSANGNGGSAITSFTVFSNPAGFSHTGSSSPITVTGLSNGTAYTFTVKANNAAGASAASAATNSVTPATLPGIPQNLTATGQNTQVYLAWEVPNNDGGASIFDYRVEYKLDSWGGGWSLFAHDISSNLYQTVTGLTNGYTYDFRVSSVNATGSGTPSNVATAMPSTTPSAPTGLSATAGNSQVALIWTYPSSSGGIYISDYLVQYKASSSGTWLTFNDGVSANLSATVTALTNGTSYDFRVSAINADGTGPASTSASATPTSYPTAPTIGTATRGNGQVSVAFTPNSDGGSPIIRYTITSSPGNLTYTGTSSPIVATGLTNGTTYYFNVFATNSYGNSPRSDYSNGVTPATYPDAPTNLNAALRDSQIILYWSAPANNHGAIVYDYQIEYKLSTDSSWSVYADSVSNYASTTVSGLTNGTSYDFRVSSVNAVGLSSPSAQISAAPIGYPDRPTGLTATAGNGQVTLNWTAPADNGGHVITDYKIELEQVLSFPFHTFVHTPTTATSATITGLANGITYEFQVSAVTIVTGSPSTLATATPGAVPGAPTGAMAALGNAEALVSFAPPASNGGFGISNYRVTSNPGNISATGSGSPIMVTGLTNGVTYIFNVYATNSIGTSPASDASNAVIPATVPEPPTNLAVSRGGSRQISVAFTPGSDGGHTITSFTVTSYPDFITATGTSSPILVSGLTNGRGYTFTVTATNSSGTSLISTASSSITPATFPSAPGIGTATAYNGQATVYFGSPASDGGATVYNYTVISNPGNITSSSSYWPIVITGLTNGITYSFTVKAQNAVGYGPASSASNQVTPTSHAGPPDAPSNLQATAGNSQVSLNWSAPNNNGAVIIDYIVEYKLTTDSSWTVFADGMSANTSATVTSLTNDTTYNFRVSALNSTGTGTVSLTASATPNTGSAVPLRVLPGSNDSGYFTKVILKPDGFPLIAYYDSGQMKEVFVGCLDFNCNSYTTADTGINPVGYWGLLYYKSNGLPSYISKDLSALGSISRLDCADANCTSSTFTSQLFPSTGGNYGPVAGAVRPNGKPFLAMDGVSGMGGILDSYSCDNELCTSGHRRTLDTGGAGANPAVAILSDNRPVISYYDTIHHSLKLYVCANTDCTSGSAETLHAGSSTENYGENSAIIIRSDGTPGISYSAPGGLRFYSCPNANCTYGTSEANSYSVHDEYTAAKTALDNASGSLIQLDANHNPVIMSSGARGQGFGNVSIYECYNPACSEGRFRTLIKDSDNNGGFPSFFIRDDGGYTIVSHDYTTRKALLYNYLPTYSSSIANLTGTLVVDQVSRQDPVNVQTSSYADPQTQNFSTAVVDLRVQKASGVPISDITVTFNQNGNLNWTGVAGDSDTVAGKAVVANLTAAPGAGTTHSLYIPRLTGHGAVRICPEATSMGQVSPTCNNGYNLTSADANVSIVTIAGNIYWKVTGLTGTGGISLLGTTGIKDSLSRLKVDTNSNHTIQFSSVNGATASGDTIAIQFDPSGHAFDLSTITISDIQLDIGSTPMTLAASAGVSAWGVDINTTTDTITFTAPTSGSGYLGASSQAVIKIGTNTSGGSQQIKNPSAVDAYLETIFINNSSGSEFGSVQIPIIDNDTVNVTGYIETFITFDIDTADTNVSCDAAGGTTPCNSHGGTVDGAGYMVDLGEMSTSTVNVSGNTVIHADGASGAINSIWFDLSTNAASGVTVQSYSLNNALMGSNGGSIPSVGAGQVDIEAGSNLYGIQNRSGAGDTNSSVAGNMTINSDCAATNGSSYFCNVGGSSGRTLLSTTGPVDTGRIQFRIGASPNSQDPTGTYTDQLTFIATATF